MTTELMATPMSVSVARRAVTQLKKQGVYADLVAVGEVEGVTVYTIQIKPH